MTQETAHTPLDERGLEAATAAAASKGIRDERTTKERTSAAIRAYLQTAAADVSGLVERLNNIWRDDDHERGCRGRTYDCTCGFDDRSYRTAEEAASTIQTLSASNAALEAEIERLREREGWKLVPVEPTRAMWAAMADTLYGYKNRHHDKVVGDLWAAMLAALSAPKGGE